MTKYLLFLYLYGNTYMETTIVLDGQRISCNCRIQDTIKLFPHTEPSIGRSISPVCIPDPDWNRFLARGLPEDGRTEFSALTSFLSDALMEFDRILIHGAAVRFQDKAYLILAPSGVGKSTQARYLAELCPGEFGVICGDRPLLRFEQDRITVCPSPWNGKENWQGAAEAPLDGLILLTRGTENRVSLPSLCQAVLHTFPQMIQTGWDPKKVRTAVKLTERLLKETSVLLLESSDVPDSTQLLLEVLTGVRTPERNPVIKGPEADLFTVEEQGVEEGLQTLRNTSGKGENAMTYEPRRGILMEKICGMSLLIPTREAMDACDTVQYLPLLWAETWKAICAGKPVKVILDAHEILTRQPPEKVRADYDTFCRELCKKGFLIQVDDSTGQLDTMP